MGNEDAIRLITDMRNNAINLILEKKQIDALDMAVDALREQPIHCKDCIYWKTGTVSKICTRGIITSIMNRGYEFCSYAERRTDDK